MVIVWCLDLSQKPVVPNDEAGKTNDEISAGHDLGWDSDSPKVKRQLGGEAASNNTDASLENSHKSHASIEGSLPGAPEVHCEYQGLASPPSAVSEVFTLGGQSDSTYEYLPKVCPLT